MKSGSCFIFEGTQTLAFEDISSSRSKKDRCSEATANINWALSPPPSTRSLSLQGGIKDREVTEPSVTTIDTNLTNPTLLLFESSGRTSSIEKNSKRTRKSESGTTTENFWKFPLLLFPLTKKWIPFPFCNKFIFLSYERTPLDSSRFIDRCCFFLN